MKQLPLRLSASLLTILSMVTTPVSAQEELHSAASEVVQLQVGDIFEILPATDIADATYTWILTQDRTFLEATRAPIFRKRLIQPGQYTLFAEIASPDGSRRVTRNFTLDYRSRQPGQSNTTEQATDGELVHTTPAADSNGRVAMPAGTQLLLITPVNPDVRPLNLDTDLSRDSNGDGNLENDLEANQTFFGSDATPLYIWITDEPLTKHSLSVTAAGAEGGKVQRIDVLDEVSARNEGMVQGPMHISSEEKGNRTYRFSAVFDGPAPAGSQLLYQWQFGDNQQSLVTEPEHTFAENGVYTVSLLIRNLRDGKDITSASTMINVASTGTTGDAPSSQASSVQQEQPDDEKPANSGSLGSIIMLGGIFIGSILLGVLAIVGLGMLRKKKTTIADTFEKVEQTLVKSPTEAPTLTIAPPTATVVPSNTPTKRDTPPASIAAREEETKIESEIAKPTPVVDTKEAPAWLKDGLAGDAKPAPTPSPAAATPPIATKPPVTPQPKQTPAWLQQPSAPAATPKPAQVPPPVKPAVPPTPTPAVTPMVTPSAQTEQKKPVVPAWQNQPTQKPEQPRPTPVKPPVPAQPQSRPAPEQAKPAVTPVQNTPAPATQQQPLAATSTPMQPPKAAMPSPTPVVPATTPTPSTPTAPQTSTVPTPVVPPVVQAPKPVMPTPVAPVTPIVPPVASAPVPAPMQPAMTPPAAAPIQNKPPVPVTPPTPVVPTPVAPQVAETPQKPAPIDIPKVETRSSDEPIAFIRAESLNPPENNTSAQFGNGAGQNG